MPPVELSCTRRQIALVARVALVDRDQSAVARVLAVKAPSAACPLQDHVVSLCVLQEKAKLQPRRSGSDDAILVALGLGIGRTRCYAEHIEQHNRGSRHRPNRRAVHWLGTAFLRRPAGPEKETVESLHLCNLLRMPPACPAWPACLALPCLPARLRAFAVTCGGPASGGGLWLDVS
eukprot:COSAG06_NODE_216_length_20108_cov_9.428857_7_plen_177_part_00